MPMYDLAIEEIDESVKRPVVTQIATELMGLFGLNEDLPVLHKGQATQHAYNNTDVTANDMETKNRYSLDAFLEIVDYDEEENEHTLLSTPVQYVDNKSIFHDADLNVFMVPTRISKRFTVNLALYGTEKQVERWGATIKRRTASGLLNGLHTAKFHYPIPSKFMEFLVDAHQLRENVQGYGEDLGSWFKRCFDESMTVIRSTDGSSPVFVIQEAQQPIQGWFDFGTGRPKKEKDDDMSRYALRFTYTFYFDVPESITLTTPLVIHNQLLPYQWLPKPVPMMELDFIREYGSYSHEAFNHFRFKNSDNDYTYTVRPGLSIPTIDDWVGDRPNPGYDSLVRILMRLDESNLKNVTDLQDMGEWVLNPICARYMKANRNNLNKPYDCVINVMLFTGDQLLDMNGLSVDENLFVTYHKELSLRKSYHLVVTMLKDPSLLTNVGVQGLIGNSCFFKYWISTLYPEALELFGWDMTNCFAGDPSAETDDDDIMTLDAIRQDIHDITNNPDRFGEPYRPIWPLVGMYSIYSHSQ